MTSFFLSSKPSTETMKQVDDRFEHCLKKFQDNHCDLKNYLSYYKTKFQKSINEALSEKEKQKYLQSYALFTTTLAKCIDNPTHKDTASTYLNSSYYYSPIKPTEKYSYPLMDKAASFSASLFTVFIVGCAIGIAISSINMALGIAILATLMASALPSLFYLATTAHPLKKEFDEKQGKIEVDTKQQVQALFNSVQKAFLPSSANDADIEMQDLASMGYTPC